MNLSCLFNMHSTKVVRKYESKPYKEYIPNEFSAYLDGHFEIMQDITYIRKCKKCGKMFKDVIQVTLEVL